MEQKKGIPAREHTRQQFDKPQSRTNTPPRVAPRLKTETKRMRVRSKKNSISGKK